MGSIFRTFNQTRNSTIYFGTTVLYYPVKFNITNKYSYNKVFNLIFDTYIPTL